VARHVIDLSNGLVDRGHEVELVWCRKRADEKFLRELEALVGRGVAATEIHVPRKPHPSDKRAIGTVIEAIERSRPDIVHGQSSKAGAIARLAARRTGVPAVYTPHALVTMDESLPAWKSRLFREIERWLDRFTARMIAVSQFEADHARNLGLDPAKIEVVRNGVPDLRTGTTPEPRIGFVGRLANQKNPLRFLKAVERLRSGGMATPVTVIGDGPLRKECEEFVAERRLSNVEFLGNVDALDHFPRFSVLAMTSDYEAFPYVALEALSFGIPVVSTRIGAMAEIVTNGSNGVLCDLTDSAVMIGLARVLNDATFGERCRTQPHSFPIDEMVESTLAVYRRACNG